MKNMKIRVFALLMIAGVAIASWAVFSANAQEEQDHRVVVLQCRMDEYGDARVSGRSSSPDVYTFEYDRREGCASQVSELLQDDMTILHTEVVAVTGKATFNFILVGDRR